MGCVSTGISAFGGFIPFDSTFLVFFTYVVAALRNGAMALQGAIHVFTHDSIRLGVSGALL